MIVIPPNARIGILQDWRAALCARTEGRPVWISRIRRIRVRAYYRQSEMFFSRLIVRAVELTTVVAAVNQYQ